MISFNNLGNMGHLGNQMFQYASLKGISHSNNVDFIIPPPEKFGTTYRLNSNLNHCFDLNCQRGISNFQTFAEKKISFDVDLMCGIKNDVDLYGYFQTEKYFKNIESEIRKEFTFSKEILDQCLQFVGQEKLGSEIISLHIRRGDYVRLDQYHPLLPLEYYENALSKLPEVPTIIFSDDPEWCRNQKIFDSDRFYISELNTPYFDMCLMTMCNYHIIANSSFSWWGAWLANSKKVIAPKKWFGTELSHHDASVLYCEGWEIL